MEACEAKRLGKEVGDRSSEGSETTKVGTQAWLANAKIVESDTEAI